MAQMKIRNASSTPWICLLEDSFRKVIGAFLVDFESFLRLHMIQLRTEFLESLQV